MLIPINLKENSKNVSFLISKRNEYIKEKIPILNIWAWNYLYSKGIDKASLKWRFENVPIDLELTKDFDNLSNSKGIFKKINYFKTYEELYGKYKYNYAGIPAKLNEYKNDILSRELSAKVTSTTFDYNVTNFFQKIILNNYLGDNNFKHYLEKIVDDVLIKNKSYLRIESFNLLRNVRVWDNVDYKSKEKWDYEWSQVNKLPYKRGVFLEYINPECVFPEPNTKNPTDYFIGVPYTLNELLLNYPELIKIKDSLYPENLFPYKVAEDIEFIYHNYHHLKYKFVVANNTLFNENTSWLNKLWNSELDILKILNKPNYYWIWFYYHIASNPVDDTSGDYCCVFINNYELYSAPIPEADKSIPLIMFEMNNSNNYYGESMVSKIIPIQDYINDLENIKRTQVGWLTTTNLAINKNLIEDGDFMLDRHKINIINLKTEEEVESDIIGIYPQQKVLSVGNVIQNISIGNPQAINLCNIEIATSLNEIDSIYPKPLYKIQLQPAENQIKSSYSPVLPINTLLNKINLSLSFGAEKYIKEVIGYIRYLNNIIKLENNNKQEKTKKILQAIGLDNLQIIVAKNYKEKREIQDKKIIEIFTEFSNQRIEQQRQLAIQQGIIKNPEKEIKKLIPEDIEKEARKKIESLRAEFSKYDQTTYFIFEDLMMLGTEDINLKISIGKTKEEIIKDNIDFVTLANNMGLSYSIDTNKVLAEIANLYNINLEFLLTNPPDLITQNLARNIRANMLLYPDSTITQLLIEKFAGLNREDIVFNPNNSATSEWTYKIEKTKQNTLETTEETTKTQTKAKLILNQEALQNKLINDINNVSKETLAKKQTENYIPAPKPKIKADISTMEFKNKVPIIGDKEPDLETKRFSNDSGDN